MGSAPVSPEEATGCPLPGQRHPVEVAAEGDVPGIVDALTEAFHDYPWTRWIVPADGHSARLAALFELTVKEVGIPFGDVRVARCPDLDGAVVAAAVALRPDRQVPEVVWAGMKPREQELLGDRCRAADEAEEMCAALRPDGPHLTVATVGVRPDHQRRGLATGVVRPLLGIAAELGVTAYLETSSMANVALYRGLGFSVTDSVEVADTGPSVWAMRREA